MNGGWRPYEMSKNTVIFPLGATMLQWFWKTKTEKWWLKEAANGLYHTAPGSEPAGRLWKTWTAVIREKLPVFSAETHAK